MFNLDLVEKLLKLKRSELIEVQSVQPIDKTVVDDIIKEINYLKVLIVRYKIAVLLKLDNDKDYFNNNYLGIEEENVNDFNLNSQELVEYNNLVSQLPKEQLQRYKIRKQMADILGDKGENFKDKEYVGVEKIDPNLVKYNLNSQQITEFNKLLTSLNTIGSDTTTPINIKKQVIEEVKSALNKLDIDDINTYNSLKDSCFKTIEELITNIDEEEKKELFTDISNYTLANDLSEINHNNLPIILNFKGLESLLNELKSIEITDNKYNEYIDLFCNSANHLYQDDNNKKDIEDLINNIGDYNYTLRCDLSTKLSNINNVSLELEAGEVVGLFRLLDSDYDNLDENVRDKYITLLVNKIQKEANNLDNINELNNLLKSSTNKEFSKKIQNMLNYENLEFGSQHNSSYNRLVEDRIKSIDNKINKIGKLKPKTDISRVHYDTKIAALEKEKEQLKELDVEYNNIILKALDSAYDKNTDKVIRIQKEIEELQKLKATVHSKFRQSLISDKIGSRNAKLQKLQKSKNRMVGIQKKIMLPKLWLNQKRGMINRHFEAKTETTQNYAEDYAKMAEAHSNLDGMFNGIKASFYDFKAGRYQSKAEFNQNICNMLNNAKVNVNGSTKTSISKKLLDRIRQKRQQQVQTQTI